MSDLQALLEGCKQNPTDDSPRRALADWLEQNGQAERAEFVRLQLLDAEHDLDWYPGEAVNEVRCKRLLKQHVARWAGGRLYSPWSFHFDEGPVDDEEGPQSARGRFERGLMKLAGAVHEQLAAFARLPADAVPWLEGVDLRASEEETLRSLFARPELGLVSAFTLSWDEELPLYAIELMDNDRVRTLSLGSDEDHGPLLRRLAEAGAIRPHKLAVSPDPADMASWEALMASAVLSELRDLESSVPERSPALEMLARAAHLRKLSRLYLSGDRLPATDLRSFFDSPAAAELEDLSISGYSGDLVGIAAALAVSTAVRKLRRLDLGFNSVGVVEARALARSPVLETVTTLEFSSGKLTPEAMQALAASPHLANLEKLELGSTGIGDEGLIALANSPHVRRLRVLDVCRCGITERGLKALAGSPYLEQLEDLDLSINPLGPTALHLLASSTRLGKLRRLALRQLTMLPATFSRLLKSPVVAQLEHLDLQGAPLQPEHVRALMESTVLAGLRKLTFHENRLPPGAIDALMDAPWLGNVADLYLSGTGLTDAGIRKLTARPASGSLGELSLDKNEVGNEGAEALLAWPGLRLLVDLSLYKNPINEELERKIMDVVHAPGE
jgi:uncharacterized protein (TIGR02996 family)